MENEIKVRANCRIWMGTEFIEQGAEFIVDSVETKKNSGYFINELALKDAEGKLTRVEMGLFQFCFERVMPTNAFLTPEQMQAMMAQQAMQRP